ncbi:ulp1 protease family, C-terminal catalytic domain-containing protein, partial [Tanacetum coccineum]
MLHMENFNDGLASNFDCGLPVELQMQLDILRRLRFKFATKILLHEINLQSEKMVEFAKEFDKKGPSEKISIIIDAIKSRYESLEIPLESFEIPEKSPEIQYESLEIPCKSHSESHEIHFESHEIQSESHEIRSASNEIQSAFTASIVLKSNFSCLYDDGGDVRVLSMMMVVMVALCSDDDGD